MWSSHDIEANQPGNIQQWTGWVHWKWDPKYTSMRLECDKWQDWGGVTSDGDIPSWYNHLPLLSSDTA